MYDQQPNMGKKRLKEISLLSAFADSALTSAVEAERATTVGNPSVTLIKILDPDKRMKAYLLQDASPRFRKAGKAVKDALKGALSRAGSGGTRGGVFDFIELLNQETNKLLIPKTNASRQLAAQALRWAIRNRITPNERIAPLLRRRRSSAS